MLDCTHNLLGEVPEEISRMAKLEQLYLRHNRLTKLPLLTNCAALKVSNPSDSPLFVMGRQLQLCGCCCRRSTSPGKKAILKTSEWQLSGQHCPAFYLLQELHVGNNNIKEVSAAHLENLPSISVLDIRDNKISTIPDEIVLLQALERLDLTNNNVSR